MSALIKETLAKIIKDSLELGQRYDIVESILLSDLPGWDSMAWVKIINEIDEKLNVELEPSQVNEVKTIQDLNNTLNSILTNKK